MQNILGLFLLFFIMHTASANSTPEATITKDLATFLYTLNVTSDSNPSSLDDVTEISNLQRLAQREMSVAGMTTQELYARFQQILNSIQPSLKKLYSAKRAIQAGTFDREARCFDLGCAIGLCYGVGIRLSAGLVHTPKWSYPTFGIRIRFIRDRSKEGMVGAVAEVGAETSRLSAEISDFSFFETVRGDSIENNRIRTLGLGHYLSTSNDGRIARGLTVGLGLSDSTLNELRVQLPLKVPLYYFNYEKPLLKLLNNLMHSLYFFDFEKAELLAADFNIQSNRALANLYSRGLRKPDGYPDLPEHPLASPGVLFHPRTLQRYAPKELIPPNLAPLDCEKAAQKKGPGLLGFK